MPDKVDNDENSNGAKPVEVNIETTPDYDQRKADFQKKFGAGNRAPVESGGRPDNIPNQETVKQQGEENKAHEETRKKEQEEAQKKREQQPLDKQPPFIKQQIERARKAEEERDQIKTESAAKLAEVTTKITELQAKIDSGDYSASKEAEFQSKITKLESEAKTREEALVNENQTIKKKLAIYDVQESQEFQEKYVRPVITSYTGAMEILANDKTRQSAMQQALVANSTALRAGTPEDRANAEQQRDQLLSQIVDGMTPFTAQRFTQHITAYITASQDHAGALKNWEKTSSEFKANQQQAANKAAADRINSWGKTFDATGKQYDDKIKLSDEDKKMAKELGIDVDAKLEQSKLLASKTVLGQTGMEDAMAIIHEGRIGPAKDAKIAVLEKRLADSEALIKKLRGASPSGGSPPAVTPKDSDKPTREQWMAEKFGANRAGLRH